MCQEKATIKNSESCIKLELHVSVKLTSQVKGILYIKKKIIRLSLSILWMLIVL